MLESTIDRCGGLASTAELHRAGIRRSDIEDAIAEGRIIRVRQGWYARAGIDRDLLAAARVGGRATCATALAGLGAWVRADADIHLAVRRNACQLRSPSDSRRRLSDADPVRVHWDDTGAGTSRLRVDPVHALADLALCADPDAVVAAADSLLLRSPVLRRTWQSRVSACPLALRQLLESADGICESGTETRFWRRMRRKLLLRR